MTEWGLESEPELDFMDPVDPGVSTGTQRPGGPTATEEPGAEEPGSDPAAAVRAWLDERGTVTAFRVSNRWRERLRDGDLGAAVVAAVAAGQTRPARYPQPDEPIWEGEPARLGRAALDDIAERSAQLDDQERRWETQPESELEPTRLEGTRAVGTSENRMVTVTLDEFGRTAQADFDDDWLGSASVAQVSEALLEAHRAAYERHVPPRLILGDRGRLARERRRLAREMLAILNRGV